MVVVALSGMRTAIGARSAVGSLTWGSLASGFALLANFASAHLSKADLWPFGFPDLVHV